MRCALVLALLFVVAFVACLVAMGLEACRPWHYSVDLGPTVPRPCGEAGAL